MEGTEVVVTLVEFAPRATTGKHTHPGHEIAYVIEGSGVSEAERQSPEVRKAGTVTYIPPKMVRPAGESTAAVHRAPLAQAGIALEKIIPTPSE